MSFVPKITRISVFELERLAAGRSGRVGKGAQAANRVDSTIRRFMGGTLPQALGLRQSDDRCFLGLRKRGVVAEVLVFFYENSRILVRRLSLCA